MAVPRDPDRPPLCASPYCLAPVRDSSARPLPAEEPLVGAAEEAEEAPSAPTPSGAAGRKADAVRPEEVSEGPRLAAEPEFMPKDLVR